MLLLLGRALGHTDALGKCRIVPTLSCVLLSQKTLVPWVSSSSKWALWGLIPICLKSTPLVPRHTPGIVACSSYCPRFTVTVKGICCSYLRVEGWWADWLHVKVSCMEVLEVKSWHCSVVVFCLVLVMVLVVIILTSASCFCCCCHSVQEDLRS